MKPTSGKCFLMLLGVSMGSCDINENGHNLTGIGARRGGRRDTVSTSPTPIRIKDFPQTVRSVWTYAIYDSVNRQADTTQIQIIGSTSDPRYSLITALAIRDGERTEFGMVEYAHDTVTLVGVFTQLPVSSLRFIFPLVVGRAWGCDFGLGWDSVRVLSSDSLSIPAGKFSEVFRVLDQFFEVGPVVQYQTTVWFVPKIGILRMHSHGGYISPDEVSITWTLLNYDIAK